MKPSRSKAASKACVPRRSTCPINYALEIFGDRWSLLVIRDLLMLGKRHFRELLESDEGIATNILAARLKKLEQEGLVRRRPDPDSRRQVVYEATEKGIALLPAILEIVRWSAAHDPDTPVSKEFQQRIAKDREGLAAELAASARQRRTASE